MKMVDFTAKTLTVKQIMDQLQVHRKRLQQLSVSKIGLFGSYSQNTAGVDSDLDFLVVLEKPTFDNYMDLRFFLEDLFDRKVDLVLEENLKPRLRPYIMNEVIYAQGL